MIDIMLSSDLRGQRLDKNQARKLVAKVVRENPAGIYFTKHCLVELKKDDLTTSDVLNVLLSLDAKIVDQPEFERGSYKYRLGTKRIMTVLAFSSPSSLTVVTAWRK